MALSNNGVMHLFSNAKYEIGGQEIESGCGADAVGMLTPVTAVIRICRSDWWCWCWRG